VLLVALIAAPLAACNVPVFRYALERWAPDLYHTVIFHRGALSEKDSATLAALKVASKRANLVVRTVDLAKGEQGWSDKLYAGGPLPRIVLLKPSPKRLPHPGPKEWTQREVVWSGALTKASAALMCDSPTRRRIARLIRSGESAVWVMLDSGNKDKDASVAAAVRSRLDELTRTLKLPKTGSPVSRRPKGGRLPKLRLAFSMLRVARNDPRERVMVEMLLSSRAGLRASKGPILFPVFGRGRILWPLAGDEITAAGITKIAKHLLDPCSCQVKDLFSAYDILIATDWKSGIKPSATTRPAAACTCEGKKNAAKKRTPER